jgi:hypothetical protein
VLPVRTGDGPRALRLRERALDLEAADERVEGVPQLAPAGAAIATALAVAVRSSLCRLRRSSRGR